MDVYYERCGRIPCWLRTEPGLLGPSHVPKSDISSSKTERRGQRRALQRPGSSWGHLQMPSLRKKLHEQQEERSIADLYRLMFDLFIINGEEAEPWVPLIYPPTDVQWNERNCCALNLKNKFSQYKVANFVICYSDSSEKNITVVWTISVTLFFIAEYCSHKILFLQKVEILVKILVTMRFR